MTFNRTAACTVFLLALALLPSVLNAYGARNVSHNLILGQYRFGDRLLYATQINQRGHFYGKIYQQVKYPPYGKSMAIINYIRVNDLKTDGTGGYPSLFSGGIGYPNVTIKLESSYGHGLHFNVSIYGR